MVHRRGMLRFARVKRNWRIKIFNDMPEVDRVNAIFGEIKDNIQL